MKRLQALGVCAALLTTSSCVLAEDEWKFLQGKEEGFDSKPTFSVMIGRLSPDIDGASSDSLAGLELSGNCPLMQPPTNKIRQQVSLISFDNDNLEITSFELNPHYVIEASPHFGYGFGPGIGYLQAETPTDKESMFSLQVGASLHYTPMDFMYLGMEARYQFTERESFAGQNGVNNFRFALKAGVNF